MLTIRENARLQGFSDYYKLFGPIKQRYVWLPSLVHKSCSMLFCFEDALNMRYDRGVARYMQVGNAVAVPVATALGYVLGQSFLRKVSHQQETLELPRHFPYCLTIDP